jgi:uncharacterized protein
VQGVKGLGKLILLIVAGFVVYLVLKNYRRRVDRKDEGAPPRADESMVRCAQCGVHHPRSESLLSAGKFYCSPEHERRAKRGE